MNSVTHRAIFAESGHFTAMHNALFDWVQPRLSLSAWSVLCVIVRRTRGWGKKYDAISYGQIMEATGIKSSATVAKALNELLCESPFGKPLLRRQKKLSTNCFLSRSDALCAQSLVRDVFIRGRRRSF